MFYSIRSILYIRSVSNLSLCTYPSRNNNNKAVRISEFMKDVYMQKIFYKYEMNKKLCEKYAHNPL
jgi:hypothetical protein